VDSTAEDAHGEGRADLHVFLGRIEEFLNLGKALDNVPQLGYAKGCDAWRPSFRDLSSYKAIHFLVSSVVMGGAVLVERTVRS
jgi:hypothetical protein